MIFFFSDKNQDITHKEYLLRNTFIQKLAN